MSGRPQPSEGSGIVDGSVYPLGMAGFPRPSPAPHLRLLTGPAGSGKTNRALAAIRAAATSPGPGLPAGSGRAALLILPTYAQVMHVKRVALSRWDVRGILDEPFTTFTAAGERFLPGFQVRVLPSPEERDRLMEEALRQRDAPVFRAIADRPGFRAHLVRLVKELKQSGLEGGEARERLARVRDQVGTASRSKLDAFLAVFEGYDDLLERAGLEDHEDALRRLARRLRETPPAEPPRLLVVDGFDDFTRVEEHILEALVDAVQRAGGDVLVTLPWDESRPTLFANSRSTRRHLLGQGFVEEHLGGFVRAADTPLARLADTLFSATPEPQAGGVYVQALVAGDAEDEAACIARAVRGVVERDGITGVRGWRDVGVIVRRLDETAARLVSAFEQAGVPLRVVGSGDPLASEPIVRALRGPLAVLAGGTEAGRFDARAIMEWLRWRALRGGDLLPIDTVDHWDMRQRERGLPTTFATFLADAPDALRQALTGLADAGTRLQACRGASALYDGLAQALEVLAPDPVLSGFDAAGRPRDPAADRRAARDAGARARLIGILGALRAAAERTGLGGAADMAEAVAELSDAIERTTLRLPDRRLDAVTLMDAEEARFWELPVVFVAGLEEGNLPLRPREDILLRDNDREALRAEDGVLRLPLAREREVRERRLFYGAVTRASRRLYLARRAYDEKGDPKEPSFFLRELETVITPTVAFEARTPGRVAREKSECFTPADLRLFAAGRLGPWAAQRRDIPASERALAAALQTAAGTTAPARAARNRRREADALWRTAAQRAAVLDRFGRSTAYVSVSRLNRALFCPQRFFLAYVAAVPQDDFSLDGPVFDSRARGRALHHVFELAIRHPDRSPQDIADAGVEHVVARGLEAQILSADLERAVALLRERETDTRGALRPWIDGLELDFRGERAVELGPEDCRFRLGGMIDRIDRADQGACIVDYKSSASGVERSFAAGRDGDDLQLPLYARAFEVLEAVPVVGFEWVACLTRQRRIIHDADAAALFGIRREGRALLAEAHEEFRNRLDEAEAVATDVVRRARSGTHERAPLDVGGCKNCPWERVCRPDVAWLARRQDAQTTEEGDA